MGKTNPSFHHRSNSGSRLSPGGSSPSDNNNNNNTSHPNESTPRSHTKSRSFDHTAISIIPPSRKSYTSFHQRSPSGSFLNSNLFNGNSPVGSVPASPSSASGLRPGGGAHSFHRVPSAQDLPSRVQKTTHSAIRFMEKLAAFDRCLLIFIIAIGFLILQIILFAFYKKDYVDNQVILHNGEVIDTLDATWDQYWNREDEQSIVQEHAFPHYYTGFDIDAADYAHIVNEIIAKPLQQSLRDHDHVVEFGSGAGSVLCVLNQLLMKEKLLSKCSYPLSKIQQPASAVQQYHGLHFFGIDFSTHMLKRSKRFLPHVDFFRSNILEVDFLMENSVDHSIAFSIMHYLASSKEIVKAIKNMIRITKVGGSIIVGELFQCDKIPSLTMSELQNILPKTPNQYGHLLPAVVCVSELEEQIKPLVQEFKIVDSWSKNDLSQKHGRGKYSFSLHMKK